MTQLTPSFLVAAASCFVGVREQGGPNRGQMVEIFLNGVEQPKGQPWCAAFVHHVGYWSHYDHRTKYSSWPLPATASCWQLGEFAREHGLLETEPQPGDVFLVYFRELRRFAHTGIIVTVEQRIATDKDTVYVCTTVEGNTNLDGAREGRLTLQKTRRFSMRNGDRFIRWSRTGSQSEAA